MENLKVTKRNWVEQCFDLNKIKKLRDIIALDLSKVCPWEIFIDWFKKYAVEWIPTKDIMKMLIKTATDLITVENIKWQIIAWRLAIRDLYKEATKNWWVKTEKLYSPETFLQLVRKYQSAWLYSEKFEEYSDEEILEAWKNIIQSTDMEYNYTTVVAYRKRYLNNPNWVIYELPQHMYMAIGLFLALPEKKEERIEFARKIYEACSKWEISLPTPTLLNARTKFHQLSSCFKFSLDDDLRGIYHWIENMAQVSKFWWGIWSYFGHIRSKWWSIRWVKWVSWGVMPWVKVVNDTAIAVNQLGSRMGSISVTLDVFHRDIQDWLDMQTETGDIRRKAFDVFPAVSIPNLFMERVKEWWKWTMFDPHEIRKVTWESLETKFWETFSSFYEDLETRADVKLKDRMDARDLFKKILKAQVETWMPYIFFRDTANDGNPNKHSGNVYSTNLCCVSGNTKVLTDKWEITIWDNVWKIFNVWNWEEYSEVEFIKTRDWEKLLEIEFSNWNKLKCTYYHTFYNKLGYKIRADELKVWDELISQRYPEKDNYQNLKVISISEVKWLHQTFCFNEPKRHMWMFNWILTWQCEIIQNMSSPKFTKEVSDWNKINISYEAGDTVVCNLASINVAKVNTPEKIKEIIPIAMRLLDNVITLNYYPLEETRISAEKYRPVGLGFMGLAQYFAENKLVYGSKESVKETDRLFKEYCYTWLSSSVELAKERWAYSMFKWSDFSKGIYQGMDLEDLDEDWDSFYSIKWKELKINMMKYWTRFGYHFAPAPNTSTAMVVGTTAWLLPVYKKYFIETNANWVNINVAPNLNSENFFFYKEYINMDMKDVIPVIATAQKYIDQSISTEFLINPAKVSPKDLFEYIFMAWEKKMKTIYYIRSMSLEASSCESCSW